MAEDQRAAVGSPRTQPRHTTVASYVLRPDASCRSSSTPISSGLTSLGAIPLPLNYPSFPHLVRPIPSLGPCGFLV